MSQIVTITPVDQIEMLDDTGFIFTDIGFLAPRKSANFGDGYTAGARLSTRELRAWKVRIDVLPDYQITCLETYLQTRARYLYEFWLRHKLEKPSEIFRMRDPFPRDPTRTLDTVYARFMEEELNYGVTTEFLFTSGLTIREARVKGLPDATDYNPQQI
jgi:hypothetical protein